MCVYKYSSTPESLALSPTKNLIIVASDSGELRVNPYGRTLPRNALYSTVFLLLKLAAIIRGWQLPKKTVLVHMIALASG